MTNRGDLDGTWYFSYDGQEVVEERNGSEEIVQQYVYGPNHIDEPVMIRGTHGTFFVYQDANWNVIGTTTPGGKLAEEYNYTPYGRVLVKRHTAFGDADGDGDIDATDQTAWDDTQDPGGVYDRNFDADYDGDNDQYDQTAFNNNKNEAGESVIVANRAWSPNANDLTFTARRLDPESMLMHYRWRAYSPTLKRFMQRDFLGYIDGENLYQYVGGNPLRYLDPFGDLQRDENGDIIFEQYFYAEAENEGEEADVEFGYIYADDGTPIEAVRPVDPQGDEGWIENCVGYACADSEFSIDIESQLDALLDGDGYTDVDEEDAQVGDLIVWRDEEGVPQHVEKVTKVQNGQVTETTGLGGLQTRPTRKSGKTAWRKAGKTFIPTVHRKPRPYPHPRDEYKRDPQPCELDGD